jgi:hypothetical protein
MCRRECELGDGRVFVTPLYIRDAVLEQRVLGPRAWGRVHRFRWVVEDVFSIVKRVFGEYVLARKFVNMVKEVVMKAYLYNIFVALTSS